MSTPEDRLLEEVAGRPAGRLWRVVLRLPDGEALRLHAGQDVRDEHGRRIPLEAISEHIRGARVDPAAVLVVRQRWESVGDGEAWKSGGGDVPEGGPCEVEVYCEAILKVVRLYAP